MNSLQRFRRRMLLLLQLHHMLLLLLHRSIVLRQPLSVLVACFGARLNNYWSEVDPIIPKTVQLRAGPSR